MAQLLPSGQSHRQGHALQHRIDGDERGYRIADDGQERVKEQGNDGGDDADAEQRNHERQQGNRWNGLHQSCHVDHRARQPADAKHKEAEHDPDTCGRRQRDGGQDDVSDRVSAQLLPEVGRRRVALDSDVIQITGGRLGKVRSAEHHGCVDRLHARVVEGVLHAR